MGAEQEPRSAERGVAEGSVVAPRKQIVSCGITENRCGHAAVDGIGLDLIKRVDVDVDNARRERR